MFNIGEQWLTWKMSSRRRDDRDMNGERGDRAVVLGAGIAGLLAARVLAGRYGDVLVVERDRLPAAFVPRRGVPQGRHAHGLLGGALLVLERYLPGITADLAARGAPLGDPARDTRWFVGGGHLAPFASGWRGVWASRPLLEGTVRDRLLALPNVRLLDHTDAVGLRIDGGRVTGARVLRAANGSTAELLPADLVVDATGRGSRCPAWLAELGYEPPVEERVDAGATYVSRLFRRGPDGPLAHVMATPSPGRRLGMLTAQEGGVWLATMAGYRGERAAAGRGRLPRVRGVVAGARYPGRAGRQRADRGRGGRVLPGERAPPVGPAAPVARRPARHRRRGQQP
jgi:hypothetical protein